MKRAFVLLTLGALLLACSKTEVQDSVSKSLEKSCSNNSTHCTTYETSTGAKRTTGGKE